MPMTISNKSTAEMEAKPDSMKPCSLVYLITGECLGKNFLTNDYKPRTGSKSVIPKKKINGSSKNKHSPSLTCQRPSTGQTLNPYTSAVTTSTYTDSLYCLQSEKTTELDEKVSYFIGSE